jgi:trehalose-6-phosphate synthase
MKQDVLEKNNSKRRVIVVTHHLPVICALNAKQSQSLQSDQGNEEESGGREQQIFGPVGADDTDFSPPKSVVNQPDSSRSNLVSTQSDRMLQSDVSKEDNWSFSRRRGHSALYSGIRSLSTPSSNPTPLIQPVNGSASNQGSGKSSVEEAAWESVIHVGWVGNCLDGETGKVIDDEALGPHKETIRKKLWDQFSYVPIFLTDDVASGHYEGYCKSGTILSN